MVQGVFFDLFGGLFRLVNRWGNPLQCAFAYACMHKGGHNVVGPMDAVGASTGDKVYHDSTDIQMEFPTRPKWGAAQHSMV